MKKHLHLDVPEVDVAKALQDAFCNNSLECAEHCYDCIFWKDNLEVFKERFKAILK